MGGKLDNNKRHLNSQRRLKERWLPLRGLRIVADTSEQ